MTTRSSPARVLQLVPPGPGGVRDYAETLRENGLGGDVREVKEPVAIDWTTYDVVLVQYSGYGYSRRGAPQWLTEWLNDNRSLIKCLGVFFHELYAPSVPWRSAFWFGYQQKAVLKSLARISDFWLTNREESGDWLRRNAGSGLHQIVLPTSSAVGELATVPQELRSRAMVIFGGAGLRAATYATHGHWLLSVAEEENWVIHDVGPPMPESSMTNRLLNHGVCMHGRLDAAEIHLLLSEAAVGVLTYPQTYMSKSSVLGAYAAHALCPLALPVKGFRGEPRDLLVKGQNYVSSSEFIALDSTQIRDVGLAAWHWYQSHGVARHVGAVLKLSEDCCGLQ